MLSNVRPTQSATSRGESLVMDRLRGLLRLGPDYKPVLEDVGDERDALMHESATLDDYNDNRSNISQPEGLEDHEQEQEQEHQHQHEYDEDDDDEYDDDQGFSWLDYSVFMLLGVAMLWAWNMFLAAGPYFQKRFQSSDSILANFQPAESAISTLANLGSMLILANLQARASYPKRIVAALLINLTVFTLLAISTRVFLLGSAEVYFTFLMVQVFVSSLATGLIQNGTFAFVAEFGKEEYTQGIMTGQAVAGVLPCVVQIASVLSERSIDSAPPSSQGSSTSAFAYFLTATGISLITLLAFLNLVARKRGSSRRRHAPTNVADGEALGASERKPVSLLLLFRKTFWLSISVFFTFAFSMFFPVFTQQIESVRSPEDLPRILEPAAFIPLAFLFWNSGDLAGRLMTAIPALRLTHRPRLVFALAVSRVVFIPMYLLCNIRGRGASINSDFFYLVVVQFLFGTTNGFLGSTCMMGGVEYVDASEREAAGGFMSLSLVFGLAAGSLISFTVAG